MLIEVAVIGVILLVDLLTKAHIEKTMSLGDSHTLIKGLIDITFTTNTGAGFGMFSGNTTALTVITSLVIAAVSVYLIVAQKETEWLRISLLFIVGGGLGNLIDRINPGYVRDFIQFAFWENFAIFNVADMFVTVGTAMLVVVLIVILVQEGRKNQKEFEEEQAAKTDVPELQDPLDAPINLNPMLRSENDYTFTEATAAQQGSSADTESMFAAQNSNSADIENVQKAQFTVEEQPQSDSEKELHTAHSEAGKSAFKGNSDEESESSEGENGIG